MKHLNLSVSIFILQPSFWCCLFWISRCFSFFLMSALARSYWTVKSLMWSAFSSRPYSNSSFLASFSASFALHFSASCKFSLVFSIVVDEFGRFFCLVYNYCLFNWARVPGSQSCSLSYQVFKLLSGSDDMSLETMIWILWY